MGALPPFQTPESPPLPRAEALCSLPACSNKSFAFGTLGLVGTGSHGGARQAPRHADTLPAVRPGRERDFSQVVPALRQSLRRRAGVRTKGNTLVLTSCRPPCGDGCVRPPVPKAKLLLEQAGSEHRASARGRGGDSGVWKGALKGGGNAPITGPFPRPEGTRGTSGKEGEKTEKCRLFPQRTGKRGKPDAGRNGRIPSGCRQT